MYYSYKVIVNFKDSTQASDFGNSEDGGNFVETAKRIIEERTGAKPRFVECENRIDRLALDFVPQEVKASWPKGLKTIPVYYFKEK